MALSCSECKRRKIKCDRNVPCEACIRRGAGDSCNWNEAKIEPSPQPFALKTELREVQERLRVVEEFLTTVGPDFRASIPRPRHSSGPAPSASGCEDPSSKADATADATVSCATPSSMPAAEPKSAIGRDEPHTEHKYGVGDTAVVLGHAASSLPLDESGAQTWPPASSSEDWRGGRTSPQYRQAPSSNKAGYPVNSREYTSALTSIKAPLWSPAVKQYNPVLMLHSHYTEEPQQLLRDHINVLNGLLAQLPSMRQSYHLATQYHDTVSWRYHVLHWPSFQAELDQFWQMASENRLTEVDPLWLSVFFMVMAISLDNNRLTTQPDPSHPLHGFSPDQLDGLADKYHALSVRALYLGDGMTTPRFRTVQTIILFNQFFQTSIPWRKAHLMLNWTALAIRTAQVMGLHTLGSNPETMPPEDPAWPPGKNAVKRHVALRAWMLLQWWDWMSASARFRCYMIHPQQCTSPIVDNVNDWELSATDWRYTSQPPGIITSTSFEVFKWSIANMLRQTYDKLITQGDQFSYSTIIELDRGYRKILEDLPEAFLHETSSVDGEDRKIRWQRNIAQEGVHSRIVRLHRPFLSRGYSKSSKFTYSRQQCLTSARKIINYHYNLRGLVATGAFWFFFQHTLGAAIVLFFDLFWSIDNHQPHDDIAEMMGVISTIKEIFSKYNEISNRPLRMIVESSFRIVSELATEAKTRYGSCRPAHTPAHPAPAPVPFATVLRRIVRSIRLEGGPAVAQASTAPNSQGGSMHAISAGPAAPDLWTAGQTSQDVMSSRFYAALGIPSYDAIDDPSFESLWASTSGADTSSHPMDLSFLMTGEPVSTVDVIPNRSADDEVVWDFLVG